MKEEHNKLIAKHEEMLLKNSIDGLLVMNPADQRKVEAMARQEAVREAERKMVACLERNLSEKKGRF